MTNPCQSLELNEVLAEQRRAHIGDDHVRALNSYVGELRKIHGDVPFFDPCGGGNQARVLLLLSDPGKNGAQVTKIASIDNPDKTARNLKRLMTEAMLDRRLT